jgi:hypothetical protein
LERLFCFREVGDALLNRPLSLLVGILGADWTWVCGDITGGRHLPMSFRNAVWSKPAICGLEFSGAGSLWAQQLVDQFQVRRHAVDQSMAPHRCGVRQLTRCGSCG